jgi:hypothetical protein
MSTPDSEKWPRRLPFVDPPPSLPPNPFTQPEPQDDEDEDEDGDEVEE